MELIYNTLNPCIKALNSNLKNSKFILVNKSETNKTFKSIKNLTVELIYLSTSKKQTSIIKIEHTDKYSCDEDIKRISKKIFDEFYTKLFEFLVKHYNEIKDGIFTI